MKWGDALAFSAAWAGPYRRVSYSAAWLAPLLFIINTSPSAVRPPGSLEHKAIGYVPEVRAKLLFFTAPWCAPCHRIQPELVKICRQNRAAVELVVVDFDESPQTVKAFGVESLPTMILLDRTGKLLIRVDGASRVGLEALFAEIRTLAKRRK